MLTGALSAVSRRRAATGSAASSRLSVGNRAFDTGLCPDAGNSGHRKNAMEAPGFLFESAPSDLNRQPLLPHQARWSAAAWIR